MCSQQMTQLGRMNLVKIEVGLQRPDADLLEVDGKYID